MQPSLSQCARLFASLTADANCAGQRLCDLSDRRIWRPEDCAQRAVRLRRPTDGSIGKPARRALPCRRRRQVYRRVSSSSRAGPRESHRLRPANRRIGLCNRPIVSSATICDTTDRASRLAKRRLRCADRRPVAWCRPSVPEDRQPFVESRRVCAVGPLARSANTAGRQVIRRRHTLDRAVCDAGPLTRELEPLRAHAGPLIPARGPVEMPDAPGTKKGSPTESPEWLCCNGHARTRTVDLCCVKAAL